jgi:hypothetical protein
VHLFTMTLSSSRMDYRANARKLHWSQKLNNSMEGDVKDSICGTASYSFTDRQVNKGMGRACNTLFNILEQRWPT